MTTPSNTFLAALRCVQQGFPTFPAVPGTKSPMIAAGTSWQEAAATTEGHLRLLFEEVVRGRRCLIAIRPGPAGFVVIDVDAYEDKVGAASAAKMDLPPTKRVRTARGGYHLYYKVPPNVFIRNDNKAWAERHPDIDVRAHGGYVIAPESDGYELDPTTPQEAADLPAAILAEFVECGMVGEAERGMYGFDEELVDSDTLATIAKMSEWGWEPFALIRGTEASKDAYQVRMIHRDLARAGHAKRGANIGWKHPAFIRIFTTSWVVPAGPYDIEQLEQLIKNETTYGPWPIPEDSLFYGPLGDAALLVEPSSEADPVAVYMTLLTAWGSYVGRGAYTQEGFARDGTNLFTIITGKTSEGKKAGSWIAAGKVMQYMDEDWWRAPKGHGFGSGEAFVEYVGETCTKISMEGRVVSSGSTFVKESEFSSALKVCERDQSTYPSKLIHAWDGDGLSARVRSQQASNRSVVINEGDHHVAFVGHVQPHVARRRMTPDLIEMGFANRFLWVCSRQSKEVPRQSNAPQADKVALERLGRRLKVRADQARNAGEVKFDHEGGRLWDSIYGQLVRTGEDLFGDIVGRAQAQCLRLSLILALADGATSIGAQHVRAALAIWEYCKASAAYLWQSSSMPNQSSGDVKLDNYMHKLLTAVLEAKGEGISKTDLRKANQNKDFLPALDHLVKEDLIVIQKISQGQGRPQERCFGKEYAPQAEKEVSKLKVTFSPRHAAQDLMPEAE